MTKFGGTPNRPGAHVTPQTGRCEKQADDNPRAHAHMCTTFPPNPPHEAPTPWLKVGRCTGTQAAQASTRNATSAGDPVAWAPTLNLGRGATSLTKLHRLFFAPTGHPFQGLFLLEITLPFRIYAADPTWGTQHGDSDLWRVASKVASRATLQMLIALTRTKIHRLFVRTYRSPFSRSFPP